MGGRYNLVKGELASKENVEVKRYNIGGGWFMTKNIMAKAEYVNQKYDGYSPASILYDGKFNGVILVAAISF